MTYPGFEKIKGWCPAMKADHLEVLARKAKVVVEIGVFGGQSFFALAHGNSTAELIAIDPWSESEAVQAVVPNAEKEFDWDEIYEGFIANLTEYGFSNRTMVLRLPSERAIKVIDGPIDVLHIDGNHDGEKVMWDVINWLPKMAPQGIIILDDINWPSIVPAAKWLAEQSKSYVEFGTWGEYRLK